VIDSLFALNVERAALEALSAPTTTSGVKKNTCQRRSKKSQHPLDFDGE